MKTGENEIALPLISRERAESAVPLVDCSGRKYGKDEREDIIRYLILGAEIQRDKDLRMDTWDKRIKLNQKIEQWLGDFIVLYYEEEESSYIKKKLLKDRLLFRDFGVFVADRIEKEKKEVEKMKTVENDIENINKLVDSLRYARDCVLDIWIRIEFGELKTNEKILEEIGRTHDFLTDAVVDAENNLERGRK